MEGDAWLQTDVRARMALLDPSVKEVCAHKPWGKNWFPSLLNSNWKILHYSMEYIVYETEYLNSSILLLSVNKVK